VLVKVVLPGSGAERRTLGADAAGPEAGEGTGGEAT
jgi:hypothetical protein